MDRSASQPAPRALGGAAVERRSLAAIGAIPVAGVIGYLGLTGAAGLDGSTGAVLVTLLGLAAAGMLLRQPSHGPPVQPVLPVLAAEPHRPSTPASEALRDQLTELGNHRAFQEDLERLVAEALDGDAPLALLLIDLDEFAELNDTIGHAAGDRILRGLGRLLATTARRTDRVYRIGGDEFAVIMPATDLDNARVMGRRLLSQSLQPAVNHEEMRPVSFSGGISVIPGLADGRPALLTQAENALKVAKRGGRTDVVAYEPGFGGLDPAGVRTVSAAVAEVIAKGQLAAVYQPIVALASGRVLGVEGLIRPVSPAPFVDAASMFEAADAGGRLAALDLACAERIVAGARHLAPEVFLSLNLSPSTLEAPEFSSATLLSLLARYGFAPEQLLVELTERQAVHDVERLKERMDACRRAGIRFAADDIGAGNSGLRLLADVTFDVLKIDLGLVQRSATDEQSGAVVSSVVALATRMGALLVAEGVEHAAQLPALSALGIEAGQGHHLGRPGSIRDAVPDAEPEPIAFSTWRQSIGLPTAS